MKSLKKALLTIAIAGLSSSSKSQTYINVPINQPLVFETHQLSNILPNDFFNMVYAFYNISNKVMALKFQALFPIGS